MNIKTELGAGIILSTVSVPFMNWYGEYETAITFDNMKTWRIIEGYESEKEANYGHAKYENMTVEELKGLKYIG